MDFLVYTDSHSYDTHLHVKERHMPNLQVSSNLSSSPQYVSDGTNDSCLAVSTDEVGIGTTSPETALTVLGEVTIMNDTGTTSYLSNSGYPKLYDSSAGGSYPFDLNGHLVIQPRSSASRDIVFATGSSTPSTRMVIDSSGNVGIGTTNPAQSLDVDGDVSLDGSTLNVDATNHRVGIGTSSPAEDFEVARHLSFDSSSRIIFFGDRTTTGSWRICISGGSMIFEKYNGSGWDTKGSFGP